MTVDAILVLHAGSSNIKFSRLPLCGGELEFVIWSNRARFVFRQYGVLGSQGRRNIDCF